MSIIVLPGFRSFPAIRSPKHPLRPHHAVLSWSLSLQSMSTLLLNLQRHHRIATMQRERMASQIRPDSSYDIEVECASIDVLRLYLISQMPSFAGSHLGQFYFASAFVRSSAGRQAATTWRASVARLAFDWRVLHPFSLTWTSIGVRVRVRRPSFARRLRVMSVCTSFARQLQAIWRSLARHLPANCASCALRMRARRRSAERRVGKRGDS